MPRSKRQQRGRQRQTGVKGGRLVAAPKAPDTIELKFSSGYVGHLRPLPYQTFRVLRDREAELFPDPPVPTQTIQTDSGETTLPVGQNSPEGIAYLVRLNEVGQERAAFRLDFILDHFLAIKGAEEDAGKQEAISCYAADLDALAAMLGVTLDGDEERWAYVLRHFVLLSADDYAMISINALALCTHVTDEEVAARAKSFRGDVAGQTADGSESPGAAAADGNPVRA